MQTIYKHCQTSKQKLFDDILGIIFAGDFENALNQLFRVGPTTTFCEANILINLNFFEVVSEMPDKISFELAQTKTKRNPLILK